MGQKASQLTLASNARAGSLVPSCCALRGGVRAAAAGRLTVEMGC